jgi:hypothetical protein
MTKKKRLEIYESFFHRICLHYQMANHEKVKEVLSLIDSWSYAHRCGNGENSDFQQKKNVEHAIGKMIEFCK